MTRPAIVVVGETKRGKSSLVNVLIGVPNLSPVDAAVATAVVPGVRATPTHARRPGLAARPGGPGAARATATCATGAPCWAGCPTGCARRGASRCTHSAPLLQYLTLVDTPGIGGLDPLHAEIALDAVERATALLFVVDASAPFSKPELDFLIEASKRVNFVVFALTKCDAYPGWRTILADDRGQLQAHAPRFGAAPVVPGLGPAGRAGDDDARRGRRPS